jgi:putative transposase
MPSSFTRTLKLKVRPESYGWLSAAAIEVNQTFNFCNEASWLAITRTDRKRKWLSGFDLCSLTAGASKYFERIGADTIQRVCIEYAQRRAQCRRRKLRWRVSRGARRSLGYVPFKAASLKRKGRALRFCGKTFRVFEAERLEGVTWQQGCFAQDAVGDWWLCLPVEYEAEPKVAPDEWVGIDLGLKEIAVASEGERLECGRFYRSLEAKIAQAQRRGHRRQAKRLHRKATRRRADALHNFSREIVNRYQYIVVGDVSSLKLVKTRMAKSVLDSSWEWATLCPPTARARSHNLLPFSPPPWGGGRSPTTYNSLRRADRHRGSSGRCTETDSNLDDRATGRPARSS